MIKRFVKKINKKYFKAADIGLSCDPKVKLKEIPTENLEKKSPFYELNKQFGIFEITKYSKNPDLVCLVEVGTDNEIVVERRLFDILFINKPIPKEVEF